MRRRTLPVLTRMVIIGFCCFPFLLRGQAIIADHSSTDIRSIPESAIQTARQNLHIAYGHTSHGSQITDGMTGLVGFANGGGKGLALAQGIFSWNNGGAGGALDLEEGDGYGSGWLDNDCGYYPHWINETRDYLNDPSHADVNVLMWSWCGQASGYSEVEMILSYLAPMAQLELEYPSVTFVYMTGHADGSGEEGTLHQRNQQIRQFCQEEGKVLFDFYDIECYDPDGNYYGDKMVDDGCYYDSDGDGWQDANWAQDWQNSHTKGADWYSCGAEHSEPLNANQKAYAAWWLWSRLAGWDGTSTAVESEILPGNFRLEQNYPNPFNPGTTLRFDLEKPGEIRLEVYDLSGGRRRMLFQGQARAGSHHIDWDGRDDYGNPVPSGVYLCRLRAGSSYRVIKMTCVR